MTLDTLRKEWRKSPRGPTPRITPVQVFLALKAIAEHSPVGRYEISTKLGLSSGVTRGLFERFSQKGFIRTSKAGSAATKKGMAALKEFLETRSIIHLRTFNAGRLALGRSSVLLQLRTSSGTVTDGIVQRDAAVRSGAQGAITMIFDGAYLRLPPGNRNLADIYPDENVAVRSAVKLRHGDIIIICSGDDDFKALEGALAVSLQITCQEA